jgi:type I restriction enzyme S subunit
MTSAINISSEQRKLLLDLVRQYIPRVEVWAYGSRVKWTARPNSDLDLVAFAAEDEHTKVAELKDALAESDLPFLVDLHIWDAVPERFHETIRKDHVILQESSDGNDKATHSAMTFEWQPFSSVFSEPQKNGLTRPKASRSVGLPMVNMGELFAFPRILPMQMDRVLVSEKERSFILKDGDLLFARQSLVFSGAGKCSIFITNSEPTVFESHIIRCRLNPNVANPLFYYYFFQSPLGRDAISSIVEQGAGAAGVRGSDLAKLYVPVPELSFQAQISSTLDALDQRIETLQRANEHLEALANAVFKSWFVHFKPVRAKVDGREPEGMDAATAALFPDTLMESELGDIPYGWTSKHIGECAEIVGGSTPSTANAVYWNGGQHCWATPKDLSNNKSPVLLSTERKVTDEGLDNISSGLLPVGTVLLSSRAPIGYLAIAKVPTAINQGFIALKPLGKVSSEFLILWAAAAMETIKSLANGSTFQEISKRHFRTIQLVCPSADILEAFTSIVKPLYDRITANAGQVETLSQLRDTLLPRLISGKLRLPGAEKLVEAIQ